jgi:hypothetical protein
MDYYEYKVERLNNYPEGTAGKEIAKCLKNHQLRLVPGYESHDLKHVLLGYQMTPLDEIRMQAFMLGNGNWTLPSLLIFLFGFVLLPNHWRIFWQDFQKGKNSLSIAAWTIEQYAHCDLLQLRQSIAKPQIIKLDTLMEWNKLYYISKMGSFLAITAGIFGMLFCFPFLWSSNIADLVGAGFPFVAGAILAIGGLINISLLTAKLSTQKKTETELE